MADPVDPAAQHLAEQAAVEDWIEAGAPSPMAMWLRLRGEAPPADDRPLTVAQAAARERVSEKTIRRRLPQLAELDPPGAYKIGTAWRIVPAALDALRAPRGSEPGAGRKRPRRKAPPSRPASTRWEA